MFTTVNHKLKEGLDLSLCRMQSQRLNACSTCKQAAELYIDGNAGSTGVQTGAGIHRQLLLGQRRNRLDSAG